MERALPWLIGMLLLAFVAGALVLFSGKQEEQLPPPQPIPVAQPEPEPEPLPLLEPEPESELEKKLKETMTIDLGGRKLEIPVIYLRQMPKADDDGEIKRLTFNLMYPSLQPAWETKEDVILLVKIITPKDKISYLTAFNRRFLKATEQAEPLGVFEHYVPPADSEVQRGELYIEQDESKIVSMMTCQPDTKENPTCSHFFDLEDLLFMALFDKERKSEAKEQEEKILALFSDFLISEAEQTPE